MGVLSNSPSECGEPTTVELVNRTIALINRTHSVSVRVTQVKSWIEQNAPGTQDSNCASDNPGGGTTEGSTTTGMSTSTEGTTTISGSITIAGFSDVFDYLVTRILKLVRVCNKIP